MSNANTTVPVRVLDWKREIKGSRIGFVSIIPGRAGQSWCKGPAATPGPIYGQRNGRDQSGAWRCCAGAASVSTHKAGQFAAKADRQHNQHLRTIWHEADRDQADRTLPDKIATTLKDVWPNLRPLPPIVHSAGRA